MKRLHALIAASFLATTAFLPSIGRAAAFDPTRVARDATWVLHVDTERAFSSKVWQIIEENMDQTQHLRMEAGLELFHDFTGVDLFNDLQDVTLYGHSVDPKGAVVILHGKWNPANLIGVLQNAQNYDAIDHNKHTVHRWTDNNDGKTKFGSFIGDDVIVVGENEQAVDAALDVFDDQPNKAMTADAGPERPPVDAGLIAFVTADGIDSLRANGQARSPILNRIRAGWISVSESDTHLTLHASIEPSVPTAARQLMNAANGLKAFVQVAVGDDAKQSAKDGVALLDSATAAVDSGRVVIDWPIEFDSLSSLAKEIVADRGGRPTSNPSPAGAPTTRP